MIAIRQPKGPEGKGFTIACRAVRLPGKKKMKFFLFNLLIDCSLYIPGVLVE